MNESSASSISFGDVIHETDQLNPLTLGFGSCCCSCSCSAAVYVESEQTTLE